MNSQNIKPIVEQATQLLELVFDEAMKRATKRHHSEPPIKASASLWIEGAEAVNLMGAGYTLQRLKQLGHQKHIIMDKKDPDKTNSPYIFLRSSLLEYSAKRVFELKEPQS